MKKLLMLVLMLLVSISVVGAQEATQVAGDIGGVVAAAPVAQTESPIITLAFGIVMVVLVLDRIAGNLFSRHALSIAAQYIDPKIAKDLFSDGFQRGMQYQLNRAAITADKTDDEMWLALARASGLTVTEQDGKYTIVKAEG